jgi:hypothetical protein
MKTINSPKTYKYYLYLCLCGVRMICKTKDVPPKDFFCNNCSKIVGLTKEVSEKESRIVSKF